MEHCSHFILVYSEFCIDHSPRTFRSLQKEACTFNCQSSFLPAPPSLSITNLIFNHCRFAYSGHVSRSSHTIHCLLSLISITSQIKYFQNFCMCQISSHSRDECYFTVSPCLLPVHQLMDLACLSRVIIDSTAEKIMTMVLCNVCFDFLWIYIQEQSCWILWQV